MSSVATSYKAASCRELVRGFHAGRVDVRDAILESALQIAPDVDTPADSLPALLRRFGNQNFTFAGTPFRELRKIFRVLKPRPGEIFCDAGAGYGHVVLYGTCVADCRFRAIEILPSRCAAMRKSARQLGAGNVEIKRADALTQSYDDVSYLFLNNPFFPDSARQFIAKLKSSRRRTPTVIATNNVVGLFRGDGGFNEIGRGLDIAPYRFGIFRRES
jgi:hypothetical protein